MSVRSPASAASSTGCARIEGLTAPGRRACRDEGIVTSLFSIGVLSLLLLVPVYLLAARTHPPTIQWIGYGFFDKRWLVATFLIGSIG